MTGTSDKVYLFDEILNKSIDELSAYFGKPTVRFSCLYVFNHDSNRIVVAMQKGKSCAFVFYRPNRELALSKNIDAVYINDESLKRLPGTQMGALIEKYGIPHTDIGSGRPIPTYLSDHGTCYCLSVYEGIIRNASEVSFFE